MHRSVIQEVTMLDVITKRKSTRLFDTKKQIDTKDIERMLCAALQAPSPKNRQPWHFTVITSEQARMDTARILQETLEALKRKRAAVGAAKDDLELANGSVRAIKTASAVVFVEYIRDIANEHGDSHIWDLAARPFEVADIQSIGAAIENMLLEATSSGISSLWMCDVLYAVPELSAHLGLKHTLIAAVALGYESVRAMPRSSITEKVTYFD